MAKNTKPTLDELRATAAECENLAQRSAGYYSHDTGQRNGVIQALVRVAEAQRRIAVYMAGSEPIVAVSIEEMLAFKYEAGEIATISMMLRNGEVSEANQKAISVKLGAIARDVAKMQAGPSSTAAPRQPGRVRDRTPPPRSVRA